jgi:hypothetical protein
LTETRPVAVASKKSSRDASVRCIGTANSFRFRLGNRYATKYTAMFPSRLFYSTLVICATPVTAETGVLWV